MDTNPMATAPVVPEPMFVKNPRLKNLLMILIFTFISSGAGLALTIQIQNYQQDQIYLATVATLPVHRASKSVIPGPANGATSGWVQFSGQTIYGSATNFSLSYPSSWKLADFRGASAIQLAGCTIVFGAGGHGLDGAVLEQSIEVMTADNNAGSVSVNNFNGSWDAFVNFKGQYIFELFSPKGNQGCLKQFLEIIKTIKLGS